MFIRHKRGSASEPAPALPSEQTLKAVSLLRRGDLIEVFIDEYPVALAGRRLGCDGAVPLRRHSLGSFAPKIAEDILSKLRGAFAIPGVPLRTETLDGLKRRIADGTL